MLALYVEYSFNVTRLDDDEIVIMAIPRGSNFEELSKRFIARLEQIEKLYSEDQKTHTVLEYVDIVNYITNQHLAEYEVETFDELANVVQQRIAERVSDLDPNVIEVELVSIDKIADIRTSKRLDKKTGVTTGGVLE